MLRRIVVQHSQNQKGLSYLSWFTKEYRRVFAVAEVMQAYQCILMLRKHLMQKPSKPA